MLRIQEWALMTFPSQLRVKSPVSSLVLYTSPRCSTMWEVAKLILLCSSANVSHQGLMGKTQTDELKSKWKVTDYLPNLSPMQCPLNKCALSESWGSSGVVVDSSESSNVDSLLSSVWTNHGAKKTHQVSSFWIRCPITIELELHQRTTDLESNCKCTYIQTFSQCSQDFKLAHLMWWI